MQCVCARRENALLGFWLRCWPAPALGLATGDAFGVRCNTVAMATLQGLAQVRVRVPAGRPAGVHVAVEIRRPNVAMPSAFLKSRGSQVSNSLRTKIGKMSK
jgi:hypothetical protein